MHAFQEVDEFLTRVTWSGLADNGTRLWIERGEQRERAVAVVFEAVALGTSGR
jgi:hypothetical protein